MHEAVRSVDLVFHAAGTNAIYSRNPLERYFRDIHVAVQHNSAFPHNTSRRQSADGVAPGRHGLVIAVEPSKLYQIVCKRIIIAVVSPAAISRVARIGSFSTLQNALKFASRGLT